VPATDHETRERSPFYSRRGLHGQLVDDLGRSVVKGALAPGEPLDLPRLQAEHEVSMPTLREALRVLAGKGLVNARQKRGTVIRPRRDWNLLDPDVLRWQFATGEGPQLLDELDEVRAIIEPAVAGLAAERRTDTDLTALGTALDAMVRYADDPQRHALADVGFHRALRDAAGNSLLGRICGVMETLLRLRDELVHSAGARDDFLEPHASVLARVKERDADGAEIAMRDLLARARTDRQELSARAGADEGNHHAD
jgi:DNA-binding FadR family transcriptional regulator